MDAFLDLGTRVTSAWSQHRYNIDAFPQIAAAELDRAPVSQHVDYESILNWVRSTETLPYQMNIDATFGEPPLTLFWHPDFYIEALFWASSTTVIHGHAFAGAFQVLAGTSLQSLFTFSTQARQSGRCRIGQLQQTDAMLLRPGSTQTISTGEAFIHSVFHLGYPSVTVVVRTHGRTSVPQYTYYRPGVAVAHRYETSFDHLTTRLLQVARLHAILRSPDLCDTVRRIGSRCDLAACFRTLDLVLPILHKQGRQQVAAEVITALAATAGHKVASTLAHALTLDLQLAPLRSARNIVIEDDLRLFLALLLTQQQRPFVKSTIATYLRTAEPNTTIAALVRRLADKGVLKLPASPVAEHLLSVWLADGRDAALECAQTGLDPVDRVRVFDKIDRDPFLTTLLQKTFDSTAADVAGC